MAAYECMSHLIPTSDPRMRRALDNWLGMYEACYLITTELRKGALKVAEDKQRAYAAASTVAEDPPKYDVPAIPSHKSPRPEHLWAALLNGARCLNELGAHYVVGGGLAMGMHGRERATKDVDFFLVENPDHLAPVIQALKTRDFFPHTIEQPSFMPPDALFWWQPFQYGLTDAPPVDVDLLVSEHEFAAFLHATGLEQEVQGVRLRVLSAEGLILLKLKAYRLRDQDDLIFLFRANPNLDRELLAAWAKKFKIEDRLAEMEKTAREYRRFG